MSLHGGSASVCGEMNGRWIWGTGEETGSAGGREALVRMYCMREEPIKIITKEIIFQLSV